MIGLAPWQDQIPSKIPFYKMTTDIRKDMDIYRSFHDSVDFVSDPRDSLVTPPSEGVDATYVEVVKRPAPDPHVL